LAILIIFLQRQKKEVITYYKLEQRIKKKLCMFYGITIGINLKKQQQQKTTTTTKKRGGGSPSYLLIYLPL
jgi:hypothetical protein